jgi:hypothetical protein
VKQIATGASHLLALALHSVAEEADFLVNDERNQLIQNCRMSG